jgi:putative DNA-invertase from lambdoid prophage Rac
LVFSSKICIQNEGVLYTKIHDVENNASVVKHDSEVVNFVPLVKKWVFYYPPLFDDLMNGKHFIGLYARVSKKTGQTVENQVPILENWAKANGYAYEIHVEEESTRNFRPVRQELIARLRNKQMDGIACVRLDRFLRSLNEVLLVKELVDKGASFYFINQGLELSKSKNDAMANMQLGILGVFAEFERELIRERTLEGLERARKEGKHGGRPVGSKDRKERKKAGYWLRWATKQSSRVNSHPQIEDKTAQ